MKDKITTPINNMTTIQAWRIQTFGICGAEISKKQ